MGSAAGQHPFGVLGEAPVLVGLEHREEAGIDALRGDRQAPAPVRGGEGAQELARAVGEVIARDAIDVLILGNHGLVVGATTCDAAEALVAEVEKRLALEQRQAARAEVERLKAEAARIAADAEREARMAADAA